MLVFIRCLTTLREKFLEILGDRLGLSKLARDRARGVTLGLRSGPPSNRPGGFDLVQLKTQLSSGLSQIGDE